MSNLLQIRDLHAWYGESKVLHGVEFAVKPGEVVSLLGRNGAGKTTILRSIMGIEVRRKGSIAFDGRELAACRPLEAARAGVAYCPEERGIFSSLSVEENLELPPVIRSGGVTVEEIYADFPRLRERRTTQGTKLSGGEQQILAIARILRTGAKMLLLDEPTEGLAPLIVYQIGELIRRLRDRGMTILLVEQNFRFAVKAADRHCVVESGRVVDEFERVSDKSELHRIQKYLGV